MLLVEQRMTSSTRLATASGDQFPAPAVAAGKPPRGLCPKSAATRRCPRRRYAALPMAPLRGGAGCQAAGTGAVQDRAELAGQGLRRRGGYEPAAGQCPPLAGGVAEPGRGNGELAGQAGVAGPDGVLVVVGGCC